jgi:hypothetical protein
MFRFIFLVYFLVVPTAYEVGQSQMHTGHDSEEKNFIFGRISSVFSK